MRAVDDVFAVQESVAAAIFKKLEPELTDKRHAIGYSRALREPRGAQLLPRRVLSPEPANRGRPAQGLDFFEKALVEDAAVRAGAMRAWRMPTDCSHTTACSARAEVWSKAAPSAATRGDARRRFRRGAYLAGAREIDAGLGLGQRRT